ncbi:transient receptor potential Ca2 channel (TRP-CC) family protein [Phytophthora infestans T30-4]|uniref:Transient receptor potential Ca2 channel (TRP-CC) family protein n=1 Tax=Phytophthora infestans (strain T30-4) TaxID=403677 RepID=D0NIA1_PHYIT|nr:transient receptor potential Ca2 channel (TRP-CC) family protein [Phytophthora infestans T30-4]EEY59186.1 transient receptor potential Ca2 channel (TRP-CC) family protein [Phytophthora infestans T30-4]|eukprot:XP_002901200.1 transient receptor potential Ca2 channel (TRP-CC) family protein [Phytophthora infestans T30-4]
MVTLSLSIYKTLPFVIVLLLPVSGLSWFEPFKKSSQPAAYGNRGAGVAQLGEEGSSSMLSQPPLKRGLVFQLTELLAVFVLLHEVTSVTFIPGSLIESISCNSFVPQMLALGAVACYSGLFVVLYYLLAAYHGNTRALELLEEYGFDLAALDKFGRVRFSTGSFFSYFFRFLAKRPSNSDDDKSVSIFHSTLVTPLHCAVATGQLETVRWLLERRVPPGTLAQASFRSNRVPPLFLAEHVEVARELLLHGADPLVIPDPGAMNTMTPLQLAYIRGNSAVAQKLEEWRSDVALTPLHLAAARNDVAAIRKFIARKTDVDCLGEMGYVGVNRRTPLHWAAISGATDAVDALLEGGADPNFQDVRGRSPLHWAAKLNKLEAASSQRRPELGRRGVHDAVVLVGNWKVN